MFETKKALKLLRDDPDLCKRIGEMALEYKAEWPDSPEDDILGYIYDVLIAETMDGEGNSPFFDTDDDKVSREVVRISGIRI